MTNQSTDFSEAWQRPKEITTSRGDMIDMYDMSPKEPKSPVPVIMVGGFDYNVEAWKKNMREFVSRGRRAMMVDAVHGVRPDPEVKRRLDAVTNKATNVEYRKITALMAGLDAAGAEKVDAVAHSEECIDLLIAAVSYPERFRYIILVEPAGMIGKDTVYDLAKRNNREIPAMNRAHAAQEKGDPRFQFEMHPDDQMFPQREYTLMDRLRSVPELFSIARIQVVDLLREVKGKGISIIIVSSPDDALFPIERMVGTVRKDAAGNIMFDEHNKPIMETKGAIGGQKLPDETNFSNLIDGFYSVTGIHERLFNQPVEFTQLFEGALTALEAKQERLAQQASS
jgi:pimeloyl-ACP methyl ester carboxylesterase